MKSLLKLSLTTFCLLLSIRVLVAQETENYMTSAGGGSPLPAIIGLLIGLLLIVAMWKVFTKSGPAWLGQHHPDLQSLHLVQDRRPAMVVDSVDAHSYC